MTALAHRQARVARVRRVQHLQAVSAAAVAEGRVAQIETSAQRLAAVRAALGEDTGATTGASLGNRAELGARLDTAREGLGQALCSAREVATLRQAERLAADIRRESAERLQTRAVAAMQRAIETRLAAAFIARAERSGGDD